jgi:hypothetical protein
MATAECTASLLLNSNLVGNGRAWLDGGCSVPVSAREPAIPKMERRWMQSLSLIGGSRCTVRPTHGISGPRTASFAMRAEVLPSVRSQSRVGIRTVRIIGHSLGWIPLLGVLVPPVARRFSTPACTNNWGRYNRSRGGLAPCLPEQDICQNKTGLRIRPVDATWGHPLISRFSCDTCWVAVVANRPQWSQLARRRRREPLPRHPLRVDRCRPTAGAGHALSSHCSIISARPLLSTVFFVGLVGHGDIS